MGILVHMGVSKNNDTPKLSILIGFSTINHYFGLPLFLETSICIFFMIPGTRC